MLFCGELFAVDGKPVAAKIYSEIEIAYWLSVHLHPAGGDQLICAAARAKAGGRDSSVETEVHRRAAGCTICGDRGLVTGDWLEKGLLERDWLERDWFGKGLGWKGIGWKGLAGSHGFNVVNQHLRALPGKLLNLVGQLLFGALDGVACFLNHFA